MNKKTLTGFILFFAVIASPLIGKAKEFYSISCCRKLEKILETARELPEANAVFEKVLQCGPLHIEINTHISKQFEGYWAYEERTIYLTKTRNTHDGILLATLLFELHNAYRNHELSDLTSKAAQGKISREDFIRAYEYVEYKNVRDTQKLVQLGIDRGIFPKSASMYYPDNFEDHYAVQKMHGHASWIGKIYDGYYYHN